MIKKWLYKLAFNFILKQHEHWRFHTHGKVPHKKEGIRLCFTDKTIDHADFRKAKMMRSIYCGAS